MHSHLINLISQVYAVEAMLVEKEEADILRWLQTKGKLTVLKGFSSISTVYEFRSYFELRSSVNFNCVFFIKNKKLIFIGDHCTFRPRK